MKFKHFLLFILLTGLLWPGLGYAQGGFSLLPCGTTASNRPCQFTDLVVVAVRVINFLLASSAIIAMFYILLNAYRLVTALGNTQVITAAKEGLSYSVMGFAVILLSFAVVNFLITGLFGRECNWWDEPRKLWTDRSCLLPDNGR